MTGVRCTVCGAPAADASSGCLYCGAGSPRASLNELKHAMGDPDGLSDLVARIADELTALIPGRVHTDRRHRGKQLTKLTVDLDDAVYEVELSGGEYSATVGLVSGGIVLNHRRVPLATWMGELSTSLQKYAVLHGADGDVVSRSMSP